MMLLLDQWWVQAALSTLQELGLLVFAVQQGKSSINPSPKNSDSLFFSVAFRLERPALLSLIMNLIDLNNAN
jgi:hypothetical protein